VTAFALVHGAWEGAWIWERLTPELEARGHRVVAMDLPCEDGTATFDAYAEVVVRTLEAGALEEVVVVGHSREPAGWTREPRAMCSTRIATKETQARLLSDCARRRGRRTHRCPLCAFPSTPRTYVVCSEDRLVNPERARRVARERLHAELVELSGSHSPFLSRPGALAEVLHARAEVTT
jgi:pimeloyl-ACP methyl ester carboxylesterase